jgi:hypothetical protein
MGDRVLPVAGWRPDDRLRAETKPEANRRKQDRAGENREREKRDAPARGEIRRRHLGAHDKHQHRQRGEEEYGPVPQHPLSAFAMGCEWKSGLPSMSSMHTA